MGIKANVGNNEPVSILTTDTVLFELPVGIDRYHVGACNIFNTTTLTVTIDVYISPNLTSASGKHVDQLIIGPLGDLDVNAIVGQGYTQNIIAKADIVGSNGSSTVTLYSEGS